MYESNSKKQHIIPATLSQFVTIGRVSNAEMPIELYVIIVSSKTTHCPNKPNLIWDMAGNSQSCLPWRAPESIIGQGRLSIIRFLLTKPIDIP